MEYRKLTTAAEIDAWSEQLVKSGCSSIALDFEGEFNLHVYGERLCLVQIYDGRDLIIIDPLDADLKALKRFLENEKIMKIMWDGSSDMSLALNGYGISVKSVLDLRPSADLLDLPKRDYASVIKEILKIEPSGNKSRFQRYNWLWRPIDEDAVLYALGDVLHLHALKDALLAMLIEKGLIEEYIRQNLIVQNRNYLRVPGQRHKKMKGYRYMSASEKSRLKKLFDIRDSFAQQQNWPPHRMIPNPDLIGLAKSEIRPERIGFDRKLRHSVRQKLIDALNEVE